MDQETLDKAKQRIDKVIFSLWRKDSVIFSALSMFDKVPDNRYETIGIDVSSNQGIYLRFNPNFINTISLERLELVLVIEAYRILLRHPTTRLKEPANISHLASSLAIDQLMNDDLEKLLQGLDETLPDPKRFGLKDNLAFEEYFRELFDRVDKVNQQIQQIWGSMTDDQKKEAIQKALSNAEGEGEDNDEEGFGQFDNEKEAMKKYTDPNSNNNQGWGKNNGFDADVKSFVDKVRNKTRMWGKYTGTAQSQILAMLDPKISCKDVIRKFGASILTGKTVTSRMKINRRFDIERPGYRRTYKPRIILAVDVSGSMDDSTLQFGFGLVNKLLFFAEIICMQFDTEIKVVTTIQKAKKSFHVYGRGGTSCQCLSDYIKENKKKKPFDGLIIFTDGYFDNFEKPKNCKVLFLMSQKDQKPSNVPWAKDFICLDRFEDERI